MQVHQHCRYVLLGDFNFPTINWDLLQGKTPMLYPFCDLVFILNLVQMINDPMHIHRYNYRRLVLTTDDDIITSLSVYSDTSSSITL